MKRSSIRTGQSGPSGTRRRTRARMTGRVDWRVCTAVGLACALVIGIGWAIWQGRSPLAKGVGSGDLLLLEEIIESEGGEPTAIEEARAILDRKIEAYRARHRPIDIRRPGDVMLPRGRTAIGKDYGFFSSSYGGNVECKLEDLEAAEGLVVGLAEFSIDRVLSDSDSVRYDYAYSIYATDRASLGTRDVKAVLRIGAGYDSEEENVSVRVSITEGCAPTVDDAYVSCILARRNRGRMLLLTGDVLSELMATMERQDRDSLSDSQSLLRRSQEVQEQVAKLRSENVYYENTLRNLVKCDDGQVASAAKRCIAAYDAAIGQK